jgi:hypothetical protein
MNKRNNLVALALVFAASTPMLALAKKPHPAQLDPAPVIDSCTCDVVELIEDDPYDMLSLECDVQWTTPGGSWPAYGASLEYEVEWEEEEVEFSAEAEAEVDPYDCTMPEADEVCTANDVPLTIPVIEGEDEFELKVKGFTNGNTGGGGNSRDYVKESDECTIND